MRYGLSRRGFKRENSVKKYGIIAMICGLLLGGCAKADDVAFAKRFMDLMLQGRYAARAMVDWEHLKMLDFDLGALYVKFKTEKERTGFEQAFIENFARGFKMQYPLGNPFFNWREFKGEFRHQKAVAADAHNQKAKTMFIFHIRQEGSKKKITEIKAFQWGAQKKVPAAPEAKTDVAQNPTQ
jgi:hypothetical protein